MNSEQRAFGKLRAIAMGIAPGMAATTLTPAEAQAVLDWKGALHVASASAIDGTHREGFADGLRWVRERFNLDTEDVDALNAAIETGPWE